MRFKVLLVVLVFTSSLTTLVGQETSYQYVHKTEQCVVAGNQHQPNQVEYKDIPRMRRELPGTEKYTITIQCPKGGQLTIEGSAHSEAELYASALWRGRKILVKYTERYFVTKDKGKIVAKGLLGSEVEDIDLMLFKTAKQ